MSPVKVKVGVEVLLGLDGPEVMPGVPGMWVSTVQEYVLVVLALLFASYAVTAKLCDPSLSELVVTGLVQVLAVAPSSEHLNVQPLVSFIVQLSDGVLLLLGLDGPVIAGAFVSMTHVYEAGVVSAFPYESVPST